MTSPSSPTLVKGISELLTITYSLLPNIICLSASKILAFAIAKILLRKFSNRSFFAYTAALLPTFFLKHLFRDRVDHLGFLDSFLLCNHHIARLGKRPAREPCIVVHFFLRELKASRLGCLCEILHCRIKDCLIAVHFAPLAPLEVLVKVVKPQYHVIVVLQASEDSNPIPS